MLTLPEYNQTNNNHQPQTQAAFSRPTTNLRYHVYYILLASLLIGQQQASWPQNAQAFSVIGSVPLLSVLSGGANVKPTPTSNHTHRPHTTTTTHYHNLHQTKHNNRRPDHNSPPSSSSFYADIEDLYDSTIKTRTGLVSQPAVAPLPSIAYPQGPPQQQPVTVGANSSSSQPLTAHLDFDKLMERILQPIEGRDVFSAPQQALVGGFNGHGLPVAADANNKTTMRFFRNNKTFASIVYTNEQQQQVAVGAGGAPLAAGEQQQQPIGKQPRKLINCHLVDLERHLTDVALFEAKYEVKTIDIEFNEMMQLIESCTNIARFKHFRSQQANQQQPGATGSTALAAPPVVRPLLVVGRPVPAAAAVATPPSSEQSSSGAPINAFQSVVMNPVGAEHSSSKAPTKLARLRRRFVAGSSGVHPADHKSITAPTQSSQGAGGQQQQQQQQKEKPHSHRLLSQAISRVAAEAGSNLGAKKLVLGEVTPSPQLVEGRQGSIKEALQEITQYDSTDLMAIWRGILPGTNWCGMGDRASSYNDLGFEADVDICCRAHDFCPIRLSAFSSGYGLFNWSFYTRSHCWCDQNFLDCLQRAESPLSAVVMRFYFTIMRTTCLHDNETTSATAQMWTNNKQQPHQVSSGGRSGNGNGGSLAQQQWPKGGGGQQQQQTAHEQQRQRLLIDQIRASLPIPALEESRMFQMRLENKPPQIANGHKQQQQQQRYK